RAGARVHRAGLSADDRAGVDARPSIDGRALAGGPAVVGAAAPVHAAGGAAAGHVACARALLADPVAVRPVGQHARGRRAGRRRAGRGDRDRDAALVDPARARGSTSGAACLATPQGTHIFHFLSDSMTRVHAVGINEWQRTKPGDFYGGMFWIFALAFVVVVIARRRA